jgi:hypothetical protein
MKLQMKGRILGAALASALLALSAQALAQTATDRPTDPATQPSSDAATQPSSPSSATEEKKDDSASMGSSTAPASDKPFTHGESKRCESLTGADKDQCDREEATKTEGAAAQETSKPQDSSTGSKY